MTITMTANIRITGSDGSYKYFKIQEQYEYTDTEYREVIDAEKIYIGSYTTHYLVTIDEIEYYIPDYYCVIYDVPYTEESVTDKTEHEYLLNSNDDIKNVDAMYKEAFGRVINNTYRPEYSYRYSQLLKKSQIQKSNPGK